MTENLKEWHKEISRKMLETIGISNMIEEERLEYPYRVYLMEENDPLSVCLFFDGSKNVLLQKFCLQQQYLPFAKLKVYKDSNNGEINYNWETFEHKNSMLVKDLLPAKKNQPILSRSRRDWNKLFAIESIEKIDDPSLCKELSISASDTQVQILLQNGKYFLLSFSP